SRRRHTRSDRDWSSDVCSSDLGGETGYDVADYLLGAPSSYSQNSPQVLDGRSRYGGLFAQDSFRMRSNLTLNLGLRWEFSTPWRSEERRVGKECEEWGCVVLAE